MNPTANLPALISPHSKLSARGLLIFLGLALAIVTGTVRADDLADINKMLNAGQLDQALTRTDAALGTRPRDPQLRFLKGVILSEKKSTPEAMAVFLRLTEEFPELPEPYNNLAVLYAQQSEYEKARAVLELAVKVAPAYATAQENLGDVYVKLAGEAYEKALQFEPTNTSAQRKLKQARELSGPVSATRRTR